jgi:SAM-dependent methyltransferase
MIKEARALINFDEVTNVLDFGTGNGDFLALLDFYYPGLTLQGVELDSKLISRAQEKYQTCDNITMSHSSHLEEMSESSLDIVFSQEVIYTIEDLKAHADQIFFLLKPGGHYIFTIGCHRDNPTWKYRKARVEASESYPVQNLCIEDVATTFYKGGFRVSLKRLPVSYPLKYTPNDDDSREFDAAIDLVESSEKYKMLFFLMKPSLKGGGHVN